MVGVTLMLDPPSGVSLPYEAWRLRDQRRRMNSELDRLLEDILRKALQADANVIQLEPLNHGLRVRQRVKGTYREQYPRPPASFARALRARLRARSGLARGRHGLQHVRWKGETVALRVNSYPSPLGEWYVLLIIDRVPGESASPSRLEPAREPAFTSEGLAACISGASLFTVLNVVISKLWPLLGG